MFFHVKNGEGGIKKGKYTPLFPWIKCLMNDQDLKGSHAIFSVTLVRAKDKKNLLTLCISVLGTRDLFFVLQSKYMLEVPQDLKNHDLWSIG